MVVVVSFSFYLTDSKACCSAICRNFN